MLGTESHDFGKTAKLLARIHSVMHEGISMLHGIPMTTLCMQGEVGNFMLHPTFKVSHHHTSVPQYIQASKISYCVPNF